MATEKDTLFRLDAGSSRDLKAAFRRLDKEGNAALRTEVQKITEKHAKAVQRAAASSGDPRVNSLADTVRAAKDRYPVVKVGGAKRFRHRGNPRAGDLVYGTEWGSNDWRFPARTKEGRWLYPTLKARQPDLVDEWTKVVDDIVREWGR